MIYITLLTVCGVDEQTLGGGPSGPCRWQLILIVPGRDGFDKCHGPNPAWPFEEARSLLFSKRWRPEKKG